MHNGALETQTKASTQRYLTIFFIPYLCFKSRARLQQHCSARCCAGKKFSKQGRLSRLVNRAFIDHTAKPAAAKQKGGTQTTQNNKQLPLNQEATQTDDSNKRVQHHNEG
jgi:hypothetical protein